MFIRHEYNYLETYLWFRRKGKIAQATFVKTVDGKCHIFVYLYFGYSILVYVDFSNPYRYVLSSVSVPL